MLFSILLFTFPEIKFHVLPPSVLYSNLYTPEVPPADQVILYAEHLAKLEPPFGDVTVIYGFIVKTALLTSLILPLEASFTLTKHWALGVFGTDQL